MLPIVLRPAKITVGLAGDGEALKRRRALLAEAGITPVFIALDAREALEGLHLLYIAGADHEASARLTRDARSRGVLVNVEDISELCDFHVPATIRRGELLLTVSSTGRAPGLVRLVREWLERQFGAEWGERLAMIGNRRDRWRARGLAPSEIARKTRALVAQREWLP